MINIVKQTPIIKIAQIVIQDYNDSYNCNVLLLPENKFSYSSIIDAIILDRYPSDKMQAVINNYLADPMNQDALNEFQDMQKFRTWAKEQAKKIIEYNDKHKIWKWDYSEEK